eukprot:CAMPEP_0178998200 /NCGR_PEP_ID=MMETSP0795-20121207/9391_1 /TAXON_ID=88552 /ORGANISM="Amoebophrya sp., Strain Ameob2" /LENGTH=119 /DNA_ID=CAMNT_0020690873 /DNA_START=548 /DNA_END=907 /DNA_ORIENTATION=+
MLRSITSQAKKATQKKEAEQKPPSSVDQKTSEDPSSGSTSDNDFRAKRSRGRLTEEEYEFIARDIMAKPPMTGYLKYHLPLRYAARTEEVRWVWVDQHTGHLVHQDLIGGGRNSDLEYD